MSFSLKAVSLSFSILDDVELFEQAAIFEIHELQQMGLFFNEFAFRSISKTLNGKKKFLNFALVALDLGSCLPPLQCPPSWRESSRWSPA